MTYQPVTPFRRAVDAAVIEQIMPAGAPLPETPVNKWDVLRNLGPVRQSFGLSDRALVVLQALLSFHPETDLGAGDGGMVVFPSNASICARLNGMPCSTMRRHLADLVRAGLILRRDSPNGKRFARRGQGGLLAFGFDLTPLVRRADEIAERAEEARAAEEQLRRLRLSVSVMRRDLAGLGEWLSEQHGDDQVTRNALRLAMETAAALRRKLSLGDLVEMQELIRAELAAIQNRIASEASNMSTSDAVSEQHHHSSDTNDLESEPCSESCGERGVVSVKNQRVGRGEASDKEPDIRPALPNIPLRLVTAVCREIQSYAGDVVRSWDDLIRLSDKVRPMMGISTEAWQDAHRQMGREQASVVLAAMLERFDDIRSPGGYLRALTKRAGQGAFSCGPMVMALANRETG